MARCSRWTRRERNSALQLLLDGRHELYGRELSFRGPDRGRGGQLVRHDRRGGANNKGTVFKVDAAGTETVLYSFCSWVVRAAPTGFPLSRPD